MVDAKHTAGPWKKIATAAWIADGKPEYSGLGSAHRGWYDTRTQEVFRAIYAAGYQVVKKRPALATSTDTGVPHD